MSDFVRPHKRQPTRLPRPWDSPGKNTGVGCHFLLQCRKVKRESEVAQSCPTLSDPMDCSPPGSAVPGIFQARVLEWGANCLLPSLVRCLLKFLAQFLIELLFLLLSFEFFVYFRYHSFIRCVFCKYLVLVRGLSYSFDVSFDGVL